MDLKKILAENNFSFKKNFGQNFLSDNAILEQIAQGAGVCSEDRVLEIGVGAGTLTQTLSKYAKKVVGYEIDKSLKGVLDKTLMGLDNVEIVFADALKTPIEEIEKKMGGEYRVVANIPYYITSPLIMKFVDNAKNCKSITAMIQKEVADRICAKEGTADYGSITVGVNAVANTSIIVNVDKTKFYPMPKVDSAVVHIVMDKTKYDIADLKVFRDLVRCAFSSRRKTFVNNLINNFKFTREQAENLLKSQNIDIMCRGETLSPLQFVNLSNQIAK